MSEAGDQQRALERDLRIQQLEQTVEALRSERAALIEHLRVVRSHTGLEGAAREIKSRAKSRLVGRRRRSGAATVASATPLAAIPAAAGTSQPLWSVAVDLAGDCRPALIADPPATFSWDLDLTPNCALRGSVGLRPGAWDMNHGGVDLVVQLTPQAGGEPVATLVLAIDPGARVGDRRWVPWRLEIPSAGRYRISLQVRVASGADADYAWAVIAEPELEVIGLAPRQVRESVAPRSVGGPSISILLPVHDPDPGLLDRTLASVFAQTSTAWELCIVDDGSTDRLVRDRLAQAAAGSERVRLHRHEAAQGISGATNAAFRLATAPYVATLDHDDLLAPDAIAVVAAELGAHPETDVVYTDNDLVAASRHRFSAALKPDWSPDLLRACMYTLHLGVYRRSLVQEVGGWRGAFDGAQDHDLVLRLSERTNHIRHIPKVLAHWRAHAGSAALGELAKPTAYDRGREAVAEHLQRTGHFGATVERLSEAGRYRVRYPRTLPVRVHLRVPGGTAAGELALVTAQLRGMLRPEDSVVLPRSDSSVPDEAHVDLYLDGLLVPHSADAIDELAGHVEAGAAAAGGLVVDAASRVVAGGVAFPRGLPVPLHPGAEVEAAHRHPSLTMVTNRLAVAGAVAVLGGTPPPGNGHFALVAMSLAAAERGRVVWSPHARFTASPAAAAELTTWPVAEAATLDRGTRPDPYWNPLLWADSGAEIVPESVHENPLLDVAGA